MSAQVDPAPVPLTVSVGSLPRGTPTSAGPLAADCVVLQVQSPMGQAFYFLDYELARAVAKGLAEATSGIVVAGPSLAAQLADAAMKR